MKRFKMKESDWADSMRLATLPTAERDQWWARLGADLGFDPATVDFVRPRVFDAEPVAPSASPDAEPPHVDVKVERRVESPSEQPPPEPLPRAVPLRREPAEGAREPREDAVVATAYDGDLIQVDQVSCGRCGAKHHGVTYSRLDRPVVVGAETLTHYCWCPSTGQPMLLSIEAPDAVRIPGDIDRIKDEAPVDLGDDEAATPPPRTRIRRKARAGL